MKCAIMMLSILAMVSGNENFQYACKDSIITIECPGEQIHIVTATYGRPSSVAQKDFNVTFCNELPSMFKCSEANVLSKVGGECNGKVACVLNAKDEIFRSNNCGSGDVKYLNVGYNCKERGSDIVNSEEAGRSRPTKGDPKPATGGKPKPATGGKPKPATGGKPKPPSKPSGWPSYKWTG